MGKALLFSAAERAALRWPAEETIDQWAERTIVMPRGVSSLAGPLSFDHTPYLRGILRAATEPTTEEIVICSSAQVAKTTALWVVALYFLDVDPWNMLWCMPTEKESSELKRERFEKIILSSPKLREYVTGIREEFAGEVLQLNGITITFRGSKSASGLSSKPIRAGFADEIDKYDLWTGREADPIDLMKERMKTFHNSLFVAASTPTTPDGRIQRELETSSNERFYVSCPLCGGRQYLKFDRLKWDPEEREPARFEALDGLVWYECEHCHGRIEETHKREMVSGGVWAPEGTLVRPDGSFERPEIQPKKRGFHIWTAYTLWPRTGWSQIAAKFYRSRKNAAKMMNFKNSWLGETFDVIAGELRADHIEARCGEYWLREVPEEAQAITFGFDVQSTGATTYHYYVVRAWGANGHNWLIDFGRTAGWPDVNALVHDTIYRTGTGREIPKMQPVVDSGYRTSEVYEWCFRNSGIAYKGDARGREHIKLSEVTVSAESDDLVELVICNPDFFKLDLHREIHAGVKWHLPQAEALNDMYLGHMVSEQLFTVVDRKTGRQKKTWKLRTEGAENHLFDAEIMARVAANLAQLMLLSDQTDDGGSRPTAAAPQGDAIDEALRKLEGDLGEVKLF